MACLRYYDLYIMKWLVYLLDKDKNIKLGEEVHKLITVYMLFLRKSEYSTTESW